jgi:hypothetical protein
VSNNEPLNKTTTPPGLWLLTFALVALLALFNWYLGFTGPAMALAVAAGMPLGYGVRDVRGN